MRYHAHTPLYRCAKLLKKLKMTKRIPFFLPNNAQLALKCAILHCMLSLDFHLYIVNIGNLINPHARLYTQIKTLIYLRETGSI